MTLLSRYEEIAEEAAEKAAAEATKKAALNMLKDQISISKISQYLNVPEETIRNWKEEVSG